MSLLYSKKKKKKQLELKLNIVVLGWRDRGSAVKNTYCSPRGPEVRTQHSRQEAHNHP